jgi:hypothetical protein
LEKNPHAKPRIEVSAHITRMNNLSVRWHPGGWKNTDFDWDRSDRHYFNLITQRKWHNPPDFHWFTGDEEPTFDTRPSNELMYIRGVGNLRPAPHDGYGPYAVYNADVVDSILICAVRSAYEGLISQLKHTFEVDVVNTFDFVTREEIDERDSFFRSSIHRVVAWSLGDTVELLARREREAAAAQEERDRAEIANFEETHGFPLEAFTRVLFHASSRRTGLAPSDERINRNTAKDLRNAGFKVDAGEVRRIRQLVERYSPETLPESMRPAPQTVPSPPDNILPFPETER